MAHNRLTVLPQAMAHFSFLESMALGQLAFRASGRKVQSDNYGSTLKQLGIEDGDVIKCMPMSTGTSWRRALLL